MTSNSTKGFELFNGAFKPIEIEKAPEKTAEQEEQQTFKIVFGTSGKYPDGTSWERDATEEENKEYESWCK